MNLPRIALFSVTHLATLAIGFALGIYMLPILIAPPAPSESEVAASSAEAIYTAQFSKDLADSDAFHWGEGEVSLSPQAISFKGELAPGPDYKLYLSPKFVETEAEFEQLKSSMLQVGEVKTFDNFIVTLDSTVDLQGYNTVIVWCETFGEFITAAQYR